jgi:hypothetical protein
VSHELARLTQVAGRNPDGGQQVAAQQNAETVRIDAVVLEPRRRDCLRLLGIREDRVMAELLEQIDEPPPGAGGFNRHRARRRQLLAKSECSVARLDSRRHYASGRAARSRVRGIGRACRRRGTVRVSRAFVATLEMKGACTVLLAAALVGGCAVTTPVLGLRPAHPRPERMDFVKVESRRPTLQWEAFPQPGERNSDTHLADVRDVTYDLRVWRAGPDDYPGDLVYARDGLPEPRHNVETDLQPDTRYFWTVRGHFNLEGRVRVTPWSTLYRPGDVGRAVIPTLLIFGSRLRHGEDQLR